MDEASDRLERADPAEHGVPASALLELVGRLEAVGEPHGLMVLRRGVVLAEGSWAPYRPDRVHLVYSVSKTVTSCAVGIAVGEGLLTLDETLAEAFGDTTAGPLARRITVEHALRMATGHDRSTVESMMAAAREGRDPVASFLGQEPAHEPGTRFLYNNGATYVLAALVQQRSGERLLDWLRPRLLDPLGVTDARWIQAPPGRDLGFSGLHVTTEDLARLGVLLADDGVWRGRRLLPEGWVARASTALTDNREPADAAADDPAPQPDWAQGYGYQLWRAREGFRADGAYGQFALVLPHDLVVAVTGCTWEMQAVLDAVRETILPVVDGPADPDEVASLGALRSRLAALAVEAPGASATGPTGPGPWRFAADPAAAEDPTDPHPRLRSVTVHPGDPGDPDDRPSWRLEVDDGGVVQAICGDGWWPDPGAGELATAYVGKGGWSAPDTFEAHVAAVDTPHGLRLTCRDGRLTARWNGVPLHGPALAWQQAPPA